MSIRPIKGLIKAKPTVEGGWSATASGLWLRQN